MKVCTDVQPLYFHILINEFFVLVFDGVEKKKLGRGEGEKGEEKKVEGRRGRRN